MSVSLGKEELYLGGDDDDDDNLASLVARLVGGGELGEVAGARGRGDVSGAWPEAACTAGGWIALVFRSGGAAIST